MNITYRKAFENDAETMVDVYNKAFYSDYVHFGRCPGYGHSVEDMRKSIEQNAKFCIFDGDRMIGAISASDTGNGAYYLGCLCIIPEYQGKGIGTAAIQYIQEQLSDWKSITLVTPIEKAANVKFYTEKCGFAIVDRTKDGDVELFKFKKETE